ncbi:BMP family ABC transporter substrate-binding protein [Bacillaceae bacterium SIJ1]|uniref:BMP family ABC transporter substrate-binding protein n=1 Tax=Litoribacterium kuwaitense TaxID=1398745 RepID=UPI0013E9F6A7|nr:BMP family ABC transporter substrate-binding protein [Litoribacterium kuwaitense]NGP44561.1 BMP family ABC transporter substrate-binding protein [Litoribacterium kuwaitense]
MRSALAAAACFILLVIIGCQPSTDTGLRVGMLVPGTIGDQSWGNEGYEALMHLQTNMDAEVFYKEGMTEKADVKTALQEFEHAGVELVFAHGQEYSALLREMYSQFPSIHFVIFNGLSNANNSTNIQFQSHAMGFFAGMTAAGVSESKKVGVIAAFEWQPEINGFFEGANFSDNAVEVFVRYTNHWDDSAQALNILDRMIAEDVDVVYPAGDAFSVPIIQAMKEKNLYAIGYVSDQSDLGERTVLTSTIQDIEHVYEMAVQLYTEDKLISGTIGVDFQEGAIRLGSFSPVVPGRLQEEVNDAVERYKETGLMPNQ